ncbi:MAG: UDP-N-acetylmuramoyl-L-alanyl-D-glutamate--2,6-diaminopimelate ligase [Planctomycetota bacterium]
MKPTKRPLSLDELFRSVSIRCVAGRCEGREVLGVTDDSRRVVPGGVFFAIDGEAARGTAFIGDAIQRGAAAVVTRAGVSVPKGTLHGVAHDMRLTVARAAAAYHGDPGRELTCVGITGTNGKTTTAHMLRAIFRAADRPAGMLGTITHDLGSRRVAAENTTPGPVAMQEYLAEMRDSGLKAAVMEVSSHALEQRRVAAVPFKAAILTNITSDHLDYHQTVERYRAAKARLFEGLAPSAFAVLNAEDEVCAAFARRTRGRVLRYGCQPDADVRAVAPRPGLRQSTFTLCSDEHVLPLRLQLPGLYNIANALAPATAALALGIPAEAVSMGLASLRSVEGRLEPVDAGQSFDVFVDYAHTEDALVQALATLRRLSKGRLIVVFGCGGDRDKSKRPKMGAAAAQWADRAFLTSDNPRTEDPSQILRDVEAGIDGAIPYVVEVDRRLAIEGALETAEEGDVVLIAGKGHETYQILGTERTPFDDREVAKAYLGRLSSLVGGTGRA